MGFQQQSSQESEPKKTQSGSVNSGSDILDSNSHDLRLEKSNILLLGPTGSGVALMRKLFANFLFRTCGILVLTNHTFLSLENIRKDAAGANYSSMFGCPLCYL